MRIVNLLAVAAVTFSSIPFMAQQASTSLQQNAAAGSRINQSANAGAVVQVRPGAAQLNSSAAPATSATTGSLGTARASTSANAVSTAQMTTVSGELQGKLDTKTAKPGQTVVIKTTEKVTTPNGTVIPKGSKLVGHVTEVQAHDSAHAESQLGIQFDRAELKNGQSVNIRSTIQSVEPRPSVAASGSMFGDDSFGMPMGAGIAGGARAMGGGRMAMGGMSGERMSGAMVERTSYSTAHAGARVNSSAEDAAHSTSRVAGSASGRVAGNAGSHVAANTRAGAGAATHRASGASGRIAARSTGIPGVMLRNSASGSASGTLSASRKNVHLDSGTQMELGLAASRQ